jgi:hypothetical protein
MTQRSGPSDAHHREHEQRRDWAVVSGVRLHWPRTVNDKGLGTRYLRIGLVLQS